MSETRLEWPVVRDKIVCLMGAIKERVNRMAGSGLNDRGLLIEEAWIGQNGADIVVAFEALLERNAELEAEFARLGLIEQRLDWYQEHCPVGMLLEDAKRLAAATRGDPQ